MERMSRGLDDVEACICTFNEECNIDACIAAIARGGVRSITVVDGGSDDRTVRLAEQAGARVLVSPKGLASQRQLAVDNCAAGYILFVDADDRLDEGCVATLLQEMERDGYDALQARTRVLEPGTYWQKGMDALLRYCLCVPGPGNMVGRPALYRTSALREVGMDTSFDGKGNEDAALAIRMEQAGYVQGVGSGINYRKHPATFAENHAAWKKYGAGDAQLLRRFPEKRWNVLAHLLFRYPVRRSLVLVFRGKPHLIGYTICSGLFRFFALCRSLVMRRKEHGPND